MLQLSNDDIVRQIKIGLSLSKMSLKSACEVEGLNYQSTAKQIRECRTLPAITVAKLAHATGLPQNFFLSRASDSPITSSSNEITRALEANLKRIRRTRAGFDISTDHIIDWHHENGGILKNHEWFEDQLDLYRPIRPDEVIMHPISFGENSITLERLAFTDMDGFYDIARKLGKKRILKAMESHRMVKNQGLVVTSEMIDGIVKGKHLEGGWRKITMAVKLQDGTHATAVFSKLTWIRREG